MVFLWVIIWFGLMVYLYHRFMNSLHVAEITFEGEEEPTECKIMTQSSYYNIVSALVWTALSFYWIGNNYVEYFYYY